MTHAMTLAQTLLACLETALAAGPNPIVADHVMLRAGSQVTPLLGTRDDECCRGLGWVRIDQVTGVKQLGDRENVDCFSADRAVTLEMGVMRCAPSADVGSVPTKDQWTAVSLQLDADHGAMEAAICCAFGDLDDDDQVADQVAEEVAVGPYQPVGVDGNCIGGTMTVTLRMTNCCEE